MAYGLAGDIVEDFLVPLLNILFESIIIPSFFQKHFAYTFFSHLFPDYSHILKNGNILKAETREKLYHC